MKQRNLWAAAAVLLGLVSMASAAGGTWEWVLWPDYRLPGRAGAAGGIERVPGFGGRSTPMRGWAPVGEVSADRPPLRLGGELPTHRHVLADARDWGSPAEDQGREGADQTGVTLEMWVLDHVSSVVGATLAVRDGDGGVPLALTYVGRRAVLQSAPVATLTHGAADLQGQPESQIWARRDGLRGWKQYWFHLVATVDGDGVRSLYFNGELAATQPGPSLRTRHPAGWAELSAYLGQEPFMQTADLVRRVSVVKRAWTAAEVAARFQRLTAMTDRGLLCDQTFHLTAPPTLQNLSSTGVTVMWETSQQARVRLAWGTDETLGQSAELAMPPPEAELAASDASGLPRPVIGHLSIAGLSPDTPYFYRLTAEDPSGRTLDSGLLTFRTLPEAGRPLTFAVIGDTESRPAINFAISKLIWDHRPHFMLNVGDLTDGGKEKQKYEWNHEYFVGMGALLGRVCTFPVPGNGEGDLYWYNRFHPGYGDAGFYSFVAGDAEFFMLDSNRAKTDFAPGGRQHEWLRQKLAASRAKWKFVAHHHPTYTSDEDDYGNTWKGPSKLGDEGVRQILPVYESMGVDAVFFGHLHTYERTHPILAGKADPAGVLYVQAGGAGGHLEDFTPTRNWFSARTFRGHHYVMITLWGDRLKLTAYDVHGRMIDVYEHTRTRPEP